jgi:O-antigen/teichoic acid export membrane protein
VNSPARPPARGRHRLGVLIAANSAVQIAGFVIASAVSLVTVAVMTRDLGPEGFGHFAVAMALLAIPVILADAGLSLQVLREISRDPARTEAAIGASLPLRLLTSALAVGATALVAWLSPLHEETRRAIALGAPGAFLTLMYLSLVPVLQAQLRMQWAVAGNVAGRLTTLAGSLVAVDRGWGLDGFVGAYVAGSAVTVAFVLPAVLRLVRVRLIVDVPYWGALLKAAVPLGAAQGFGQLYYRVDSVLLAALRPVREVGLYTAAFKFAELTQVVASVLVNSVFPSLARFVTSGDPRLPLLVQRAFDTLLFLATPLAVVAILEAENIVVALGGPEFAEAALALQILAAYPIASFLNALVERAVIAAGRDRLVAAWSAGFLVVNVAVNIVLIPLFGYVAAAGTAVVTEFAGLMVGLLFFRRLFGFLPPLRGAALVALAAAAMAVAIVMMPGPVSLGLAVGTAAYLAVTIAPRGPLRDIIGDVAGGLRRADAA